LWRQLSLLCFRCCSLFQVTIIKNEGCVIQCQQAKLRGATGSPGPLTRN
jgi:hypothetical protein